MITLDNKPIPKSTALRCHIDGLLFIYDGGKNVKDRYTVAFKRTKKDEYFPRELLNNEVSDSLFLYEAVIMTENPVEITDYYTDTILVDKHLGKKIKYQNLPESCRNVIETELRARNYF